MQETIAPYLTSATTADCQRIRTWRNSVADLGSTRRKVGWHEHVAWFRGVLGDPNVMLWVIEPDAGTVRVERRGDSAILSIYLRRQWQGQGIGPKAIRAAVRQAFAAWPVVRVKAYIVAGNLRSRRAFEKAGFVDSYERRQGHWVMEREREA